MLIKKRVFDFLVQFVFNFVFQFVYIYIIKKNPHFFSLLSTSVCICKRVNVYVNELIYIFKRVNVYVNELIHKVHKFASKMNV